MKPKQITAEQFALETSKFLGQAQRSPLVVRSSKGPALVIRAVRDDDLVDELIADNPRFQASIQRGRQNRDEGKGIPLKRLRRSL